MSLPSPHQPHLPHPSRVVPKIVLLLVAAFAFIHLFVRLGHEPDTPRPVRVSLAHAEKDHDPVALLHSGLILPSPWELALTPVAQRLDYPLGSEHGALTYNARPFREANHLGEDLNGIGGRNSDLNDPIYAIARGRVLSAGPATEGWGNAVLIQHRSPSGAFYQSFYAHLDSVHVAVGETVHRGMVIGTVGTASGIYLAHLHFEVRDGFNLGAGKGYAPLALDRLPGEPFLNERRGAPGNLLTPALDRLMDRSREAAAGLETRLETIELPSPPVENGE